jgi:hypothetical protein
LWQNSSATCEVFFDAQTSSKLHTYRCVQTLGHRFHSISHYGNFFKCVSPHPLDWESAPWRKWLYSYFLFLWR